MAFVKNLFDKNFIEYASYVIRDRAIPDVEDGLKPVQRRVLHTLLEIDDGKFHKVANVVGQAMKYHPHGDSSIYGALVVLANKELFIDKQGNFGNIYTGDGASAARYIECRIRSFAKDVLYNPQITQYVPSYDGRNKEPVVFRAKLPLCIIMGAEGIAVGMSTKILSHNIKEVIEAEIKCLNGEDFKIYPDFPTGGLMDVSDYQDGLGKIITRAKMDLSDEKRIIITELPYGSNTESLMESIEKAAKAGKVKISSINDFTTNKVEIEIKLQRGVYAKDVVDSLFAFTDCEQTVYCNLLVIKDNMPQVMTVTDVIKNHSKQLLAVLKDELELERANLTEKLHLRTLERIFIEERIYKKIEEMKTAEAVNKAVKDGFKPFKDELIRPINDDDVDHLLKIPIRRISLYDINKNRAEVQEINARLKEIAKLLKNLKAYAIGWLEGVLKNLPKELTQRHTTVKSFDAVDAREVVKRDTPLRYDSKTGYLGTAVSTGDELFKVTPYDRIFVLRKSGIYAVIDVPDKIFVDTNLWYCALADKEELSKVLFTVIYRDPKTKYAYIKRCRVEQYILNRDYLIAPEGQKIVHIDTRTKFSFKLHYEPKPRVKILEEDFNSTDYEERGLKAQGYRLSNKEAVSITLLKPGQTAAPKAPDQPELLELENPRVSVPVEKKKTEVEKGSTKKTSSAAKSTGSTKMKTGASSAKTKSAASSTKTKAVAKSATKKSPAKPASSKKTKSTAKPASSTKTSSVPKKSDTKPTTKSAAKPTSSKKTSSVPKKSDTKPTTKSAAKSVDKKTSGKKKK